MKNKKVTEIIQIFEQIPGLFSLSKTSLKADLIAEYMYVLSRVKYALLS